ncbi:MAG: PhnD/SsuA/transferrin family substrate-binding protein [Ardenticatenaceae bacterium]|nr:PhnD/SsuA/transferrin family substrate-binding protein [Ardenticatenaceae bacterium]
MRRIALMSLVCWLVACQPQVVAVEVTRLVEAETAVSAPPIEVTRLVPITREVVVEATRLVETAVEVTKTPLGSKERPLQLLFTPTINTDLLSQRVQPLLEAIQTATGLHVAVGIVDDEQTLIGLLCQAPQDTIGFLTAVGYTLAQQQCHAQLGLVAVHDDGYAWQADMLVARPDRSGVRELTDLAALDTIRLAVNSADSLQTRYIEALLIANGITVSETQVLPGDNSSLLAVYDNTADMATATFTPPILPFAEQPWRYGEDTPELWRRLGLPPTRSGLGYILVNGAPEAGGYRIRDARAGVFDSREDIFDVTRIMTITAPIPNETIAFGADFPLGLSRTVTQTLLDFAAADVCATSLCSPDFYGWAGLAVATDDDYEPIRFVAETLNLPLAALLEIGD